MLRKNIPITHHRGCLGLHVPNILLYAFFMSVVFLYVGCFSLCFLCPSPRPSRSSLAGRSWSSWQSQGNPGFLLQDIVDLMTPSAVYQAGILFGPTLLPRLEVPRFGERSSGWWIGLRGEKRKLCLLAGCSFFVNNFFCANVAIHCFLWSVLNCLGLFCVWQVFEGVVSGWVFLESSLQIVSFVWPLLPLNCIEVH